MVFLTIGQVLTLQRILINDTGGSHGVRDAGAVESAVAQPQMTFAGSDLYPTLIEKAAALGFSLIQNHPFVDGNKRTGLASTVAFLRANGHDLSGTADEQERTILAVAAGELAREEWTAWVRAHVAAREAGR
jgi:death-on-curing protein